MTQWFKHSVAYEGRQLWINRVGDNKVFQAVSLPVGKVPNDKKQKA